ncbi:ABC transporter permease [Arenicella xantha]|uniref:Putative lysophospholipase L1 biosynthesis ABC-type transport system permease subunit n=1 Tax=Arenicella xantha TaxID=644221 RepID=A0A395JLM3_9GAMM|nr:FtsX-like permease family protein [Arenicella xantha]RBP49912.1 putative lysophospholipase L1 biosynthesis ABC-type transport system permease subunit [Arenicella xantha]
MNQLVQIAILMKRLGRRTLAQRANYLLSLSIVVCSGVAASLGFFANSVQTALDNDIANYLGAPLVVRSDHALPLHVFRQKGLEPVVVTSSFTTGAIGKSSTSNNVSKFGSAKHSAYQSVSLKGVSNNYPLQGDLIIRTANGSSSLRVSALKTDSVWLDPRAMTELNAHLGELIQVGAAWLTVAGVIEHEPDRLTQFQHALPRAMVNLETLANTKVSVDNDRGKYRVLVAGKADALSQLESQLVAEFGDQFEILKPNKGQHPFSRISVRAERMLSVVLVLILLMCGGAAATLAGYTVQGYAMPATVLRCMGVSRRAVAWALCLQLLALALVMGLVGCLLGWLVQPLLISVMEPHMTLMVAQFNWKGLFGPVGMGLVTVIAFVVPKFQSLGSMPVTRVLRGDIEQPKRFYSTTLFAASIVLGMLWYSSDNLQLTMMLAGAVIVLIALSIGFGWGLSKLCGQAHRLLSGPLKVAVRSIARSPGRHMTALVSVSIVMMAILMTVTLRGSFLDMLQVQMLETDGNYIFTGLPTEHGDEFRELIESREAMLKGMYPTVSAKLVSINGEAIESALNKESDTREETRSKVRLSWSESLPDNNSLLSGVWPEPDSNEVSVEHEVMTDLGLKVGDQLGFQIGDAFLSSTITSQREYRGGGSRMMFWFMFSRQALEPFEQRYMGGLLLKQQAHEFLSELSQRFPQVRITDLERQIAGIRSMMKALTRLMNTTLCLLLAGAVMLILATSFVSASHRQTQSSLMRALGLRRAQCYVMNTCEQLMIGLVACLVGALGVQLIAGMMFDQLFALPYELEWGLAFSLAALICSAFVGLGWLFAFRQLQQAVKLS